MVNRFVSGAMWHLLEIAVFIAVVVADAYGLVPLTQTIILVPLIWVVLRLRGEPWQAIGFRWPNHLVPEQA